MVNTVSHYDSPASTKPHFALPLPAQIPDLQGQNFTMRLDQLRLLFDAGTLMAAEIVTAPLEPGPALEL